MSDQDNQSEVARLRAQIQVEYESAQLAMTGFAEVSKHERITAYMENMGKLHEELGKIDEEADQFLVDTLEGGEIARLLAEFQNVPSYFERFRK